MEAADQGLSRQDLRTTVANAEPQLAEVKARFFSAAAHELRTPLTTIVGYLEMLLGEEFGPLSDDQRGPLEVVNESAQRLHTVTSHLLAVARLDAGQITLDARPTDLAALVRTVVDSVGPRLRVKAQRLELAAPSDLPSVLCDAGRAMQIVETLLRGACERIPIGGAIGAHVARAVEKGFLQLTVTDTGPALGAREMAEMAEYLSLGGMGLIEAGVADLDLYVACSLVELHGGRFWCESEPGEGNAFYVTFPIAGRQAST
jgi:signal transduction histidine kinase